MRQIATVSLALLVLGGCGQNRSRGVKEQSTTKQESGMKGSTGAEVHHTEHSVRTEFQWDGGIIRGRVTNLTSDPIAGVDLTMELVDQHMMPLQTVHATNTSGIGPNGYWDFTVAASHIGARQVMIRRTDVR